MPLAITALLDPQSETALEALCRQLAERCLAAGAPAEVRPHLTVAISPALDAGELREPLASWCGARGPVAVRLSSVGTFPGAEGVVFLAPVVTAELLVFHGELHALLAALGVTSVAAYRPGLWVPHITLATGVPDAMLGEALRLARQAPVFRNVSLVRVALAEFPPLRGIVSYPLGAEANLTP